MNPVLLTLMHPAYIDEGLLFKLFTTYTCVAVLLGGTAVYGEMLGGRFRRWSSLVAGVNLCIWMTWILAFVLYTTWSN